MAKAGDKPKLLKTFEQKTEEVAGWEDPVRDRYKFEKTLSKLSEKGFNAEKENGVIIINSSLDKYDEIEKIIKACKFESSWGVRNFSKVNKKIELEREED